MPRRPPRRDPGFESRLIEAMDHARLRPKALADLLGVHDGTVSRWRSGVLPLGATLTALASALGVRPEWLKTGEGERKAVGAPSGPAAPSEAVARYYADVRAMLLRRAGGTVNADVMLDAWEGLWRRLTATPASGDPVDGEDAADVRRAAALRQAEAQHRLQRGG